MVFARDNYDIPYGCLLPKGVENLLVAGRCSGYTHEAMASTRVMSTCMAVGEAAGRAAEREAPGGEPHILHRVRTGLEESLALAGQAGIAEGKIILDPGIGFGKTREENLALIGSLKKLKDMFSLPFLLGASRKSVIGLTLNLPETEREEGTLVTTVYAFLQECMFVRVHDVRANKRALRMAEAIREAREYSGGWEWIK